MKARYPYLLKKALPLAAMLCSAASALHAAGKVDPDFAKVVQPFIENHCMDCHDADSARAGFRLDTLGTDFTAGNTADQWKEVMDNINSGKMPPKKKARPDAKEAFAAASWVAAKLRETELAAQGAGGRSHLPCHQQAAPFRCGAHSSHPA